jgi:hypothetical protein
MDVAPQSTPGFGNSALSVSAAADLMAKMRESQTTPPANDEATDQRRPPLAESPDPEPVDVSEPDEALESDSTEQPEDTTPDGPLTLTDDVKVRLPDGTELSGAEIRRGLLREADYTRKTQALAEQRGVLEQTVQQLSYHLGTMRQQATAELQRYAQTDWAALYDKNPAEYQATRLRYEQAQQRTQLQQQAEKEFLSRIEQVQQVERKQRAEEASRYLAENYPNGWSDGEYNSLMEYAVGQGWRRDSVAQWDDPLVFMMLRKAKAFDEAQKVSTKKVVPSTGQKTLRSTRGAAPKPGAEQQRKEALKGIQQAGSTVSRLQAAAEFLGQRRQSR